MTRTTWILPVALIPVALVAVHAIQPLGDERELALGSWPQWGGNALRSWNLATPGRATSWDYARWEIPWTQLNVNDTDIAYSASSVGDLDGDGSEEIVTVLAPIWITETTRLEVWRADAVLAWFIERGEAISPPVLYDLDMDGDMEIYVAHGPYHELLDTRGQVLWNTTKADFVCGSTCSFAGGADLNEDGVTDLLIASEAETPFVMAVNGRNGSTLWVFPLGCGWSSTPMLVLDGPVPLVVVGCQSAGGPGDLGGSAVFGIETRPLEPAAVNPLVELTGVLPTHEAVPRWIHSFNRASGPAVNPANVTRSLTAGDVTGDGRADVVVGLHSPHQIVVLDSQDGTEVSRYSGDPSLYPILLATADLDGDGVSEVIEGTHAGVAAYSFGTQPVKIWDTFADIPTNGAVAGAADFDGDGDDEVVAGFQNGELCGSAATSLVAILDGDGTVLWRDNVMESCTMPSFGFAVADLDRDEDLEMLWPSQFGYLVYGHGPQLRLGPLQPPRER